MFFCFKKKLLEQKRFEKIFQFIENFANFESKHPGIFEKVTPSFSYFFLILWLFFPYTYRTLLNNTWFAIFVGYVLIPINNYISEIKQCLY